MLELKKSLPDNYLESGLNLLYFGDKHYQYKKPANRMDDFSETEKEKVRQVRKLAKKHKVRAFLQPGDFLDKPRIPDDFVQAILDEWGFSAYKQAREDYEAGKLSKEQLASAILDYIPIIGTVGNHEVFGGSLKTLPRTSLGFLSSIGFINLVDRDTPFILKTRGGRSVAVSGLPYDLNLLKDRDAFLLQEKKGDTDIYLVHEALYNTSLGADVGWLPIDTVYKDTKADVTIAGHIHHGFGWLEKDGKIFGNPGALAQQSAADSELDRDLYVSLIHVAESGEIYVKDLKLDSPRSRDLFDLSVKETKVSSLNQLSLVKEAVEQLDPIENSDLNSLIQAVGKTDDIDQDAVELAIETTRSAEERIREVQPLDPDVDYRIKQIKLKNFESHANTTIDLMDDRVPYVFIGESSNGKSSIARALYWVLENEGSSVDFVRRAKGVNEASVTITRADGLSVTRIVEVKRTRAGSSKPVKNGWIVRYPDGTETETNTTALPEIQRLFGFSYVYLDEKEKVSLNFRKQEDGHFFLSLKDKQRAKLVGSLYGTQYLLGAVKDLESKRRSLGTETKTLSSEKDSVEKQLGQLQPLDSLLEQKQVVNKGLKKLEEREFLLEQIQPKIQELRQIQKRGSLIDSYLEVAIEGRDLWLTNRAAIEKKNKLVREGGKLLEKLAKTKIDLNIVTRLSGLVSELKELESEKERLKQQERVLEMIGLIPENLNKTSAQLKKNRDFLSVVESANLKDSSLKELLDLDSKLNQLQTSLLELSKSQVRLKQLEDGVPELKQLEVSFRAVKDTVVEKRSVFVKGKSILEQLRKVRAELKQLEKESLVLIKEKETVLEQIQREEESVYLTVGDTRLYGVGILQRRKD